MRRVWQMKEVHDALAEAWRDDHGLNGALEKLRARCTALEEGFTEQTHRLLADWEQRCQGLLRRRVHLQGARTPDPGAAGHPVPFRQDIPKISLPRWADPAEIYRWLRRENLPGRFPYTAGVFPFKRTDEDPTRMFAGEGDPFRTNRRFKLLSQGAKAARLSTAFDSVTLYGWDPDERPDIYGKVGNSGVSICTLEDEGALRRVRPGEPQHLASP